MARNAAISKVRFVVDVPSAVNNAGLAVKPCATKAWHVLLAVAYNLRRLPTLYVESLLPTATGKLRLMAGKGRNKANVYGLLARIR